MINLTMKAMLVLVFAALVSSCTTEQRRDALTVSVSAARLITVLDRLDWQMPEVSHEIDVFTAAAGLTPEEEVKISAARDQINSYRRYLRRVLGDDPGAREVVFSLNGVCRAYRSLPPTYRSARAVLQEHKDVLRPDAGYLLGDWDIEAQRMNADMSRICEIGNSSSIEFQTIVGVLRLGVDLYTTLR